MEEGFYIKAKVFTWKDRVSLQYIYYFLDYNRLWCFRPQAQQYTKTALSPVINKYTGLNSVSPSSETALRPTLRSSLAPALKLVYASITKESSSKSNVRLLPYYQV